MKIETKFDMGQEVFFITPRNLIVDLFVISIKITEGGIIYYCKENDYDSSYISEFEENTLFSKLEDAIKQSLLKHKNKIMEKLNGE